MFARSVVVNNLSNILNSKIFIGIALGWSSLLSIMFFSCYLFYDKSQFIRAIADFFISFSLIKRTKTILLSYGFICLIVSLAGFMFLLL